MTADTKVREEEGSGSGGEAARPDIRQRIVFGLVVLAVFALQAASGNAPVAGLSHWLIPDAQAAHLVLAHMASFGAAAMNWILPEQFVGFPINPFLYLYYYPFYVVAGGLVGAVLANQLVVQAVARRWFFLGVFLTPYFVLSFALPSKDLMVLALSVPFLGCLLRRSYVAAFAWAVAIFLVRDGGGLVALACILARILAPDRSRVRLLAVISGTVVLAGLTELLFRQFGDLFILSRNMAHAEEGAFDVGGGGAGDFLIRLFANATNLAFRPSVVDIGGNVAVLGIAYWVSGVSLLVCLYYALKWLWSEPPGEGKKSDEASLVAMLFLTSLVVISVNPAVQPRYQLFFVVIFLQYILATVSTREIVLIYVMAMLASGLAAAAYVVSGIGLPGPSAEGDLTSFL